MARSGVGKVLLFFMDLLVVASTAALAGAAFYLSRNAVPELPAWVSFAGRLHPMVLHVPLGALVLIAIVELFRAFRGRDALDALCMFFVVLAGFLAAAAGLALSLEGGYNVELLSFHMWLAIGAYGTAGLTLLLRLRIDPEALVGPGAYRLALIISAGLIGAAGHFGGTLTHGSHYLTEHAGPALASLGIDPGILGLAAETAPAASSDADAAPAAASAYEAHVAPILQAYCMECHSDDKFKGGLRMHALEGILAGGDSGPAVLPGNAAESLLIERISLPMDDFDHMPPEGKPQPDAAQIEILRWWIDAGASAAVLAEDLPTPAETPETEAPSPEPAIEPEPEPESGPEPGAAREALAEQLAAYQASFPGALNWVAEDSDQLSFTAVSFRNEFDDAALAQLVPFAAHLLWIDLSGTQITEAGLAALLPKATSVERLNLSGTAVDAKTLALLSPEAPLAVLNLFDSAADDGALVVLASRKELERLYVGRTQVTEAAIAGLTALLPDCEVIGAADVTVAAVPVEPLVAEAVSEESSASEAPAETPEAAPPIEIAYEEHVAPILEANCAGCHGETRQRGGLRLDSIDAILAGGNSGDVVGQGDAEASELLRRVLLPTSDEDHMPPPRSPQPSADEIDVLRQWIAAGDFSTASDPQESVEEASDDAAAEVASSSASAYDVHVAPIFAQNCVGCHGAEKVKGGLRLDSLESIAAGGSSGETVVAGDADGSLLIQRVELPLDDFDHMPPEDSPQPSAAQLALLRWWIGAGASAEVLADAAPVADAE